MLLIHAEKEFEPQSNIFYVENLQDFSTVTNFDDIWQDRIQ